MNEKTNLDLRKDAFSLMAGVFIVGVLNTFICYLINPEMNMYYFSIVMTSILAASIFYETVEVELLKKMKDSVVRVLYICFKTLVLGIGLFLLYHILFKLHFQDRGIELDTLYPLFLLEYFREESLNKIMFFSLLFGFSSVFNAFLIFIFSNMLMFLRNKNAIIAFLLISNLGSIYLVKKDEIFTYKEDLINNPVIKEVTKTTTDFIVNDETPENTENDDNSENIEVKEILPPENFLKRNKWEIPKKIYKTDKEFEIIYEIMKTSNVEDYGYEPHKVMRQQLYLTNDGDNIFRYLKENPEKLKIIELPIILKEKTVKYKKINNCKIDKKEEHSLLYKCKHIINIEDGSGELSDYNWVQFNRKNEITNVKIYNDLFHQHLFIDKNGHTLIFKNLNKNQEIKDINDFENK